MVLRNAIMLGLAFYGSFAMSDNVPPAYAKVAQQYQVPAQVMYAIALTESGRKSNGLYRPWPWTLNVAGKAQFFQTREQAQVALANALARNIHQIDIGLMQVNWAYHHSRVPNAAALLDPYTNLHTSAQILSEYRQGRDLWSAVGRYHSGTPHIAKGYRERVAKRLINFLGRVVSSPAKPIVSESLSLSEMP